MENVLIVLFTLNQMGGGGLEKKKVYEFMHAFKIYIFKPYSNKNCLVTSVCVCVWGGGYRLTDRQKERERRGVCVIVCVCTVVFPLSLSAFKLVFSFPALCSVCCV